MRYGWQFDSHLWKQVSAELRNSISWQHTGLQEVEATIVPECSGIYMLCACPPPFRFSLEKPNGQLFAHLLTPIYVGRSENLRKRFRQHCQSRKPEILQAIECFGTSLQFWFHIHPAEYIEREESLLIDCFGPNANRIRGKKIVGQIGVPVKL